MKRFKESFGIKSKSQLILVFIVFGITGTISAAISAPVMNLFGLSLESFPELFYWPVRLLIIFPIYQVLDDKDYLKRALEGLNDELENVDMKSKQLFKTYPIPKQILELNNSLSS